MGEVCGWKEWGWGGGLGWWRCGGWRDVSFGVPAAGQSDTGLAQLFELLTLLTSLAASALSPPHARLSIHPATPHTQWLRLSQPATQGVTTCTCFKLLTLSFCSLPPPQRTHTHTVVEARDLSQAVSRTRRITRQLPPCLFVPHTVKAWHSPASSSGLPAVVAGEALATVGVSTLASLLQEVR